MEFAGVHSDVGGGDYGLPRIPSDHGGSSASSVGRKHYSVMPQGATASFMTRIGECVSMDRIDSTDEDA